MWPRFWLGCRGGEPTLGMRQFFIRLTGNKAEAVRAASEFFGRRLSE